MSIAVKSEKNLSTTKACMDLKVAHSVLEKNEADRIVSLV